MTSAQQREFNIGWTPIRRGEVYCSPLCGGGCTWKEFITAMKQADELAVQCGPGFTRHVHENLGWHVGARSASGTVHVCRSGSRNFTAYLGENGGGRYVAFGSTAKKAVSGVIAEAQKDIQSIEALLKGLTG